jgi:LPXTG-motif cell wall-anchored protein
LARAGWKLLVPLQLSADYCTAQIAPDTGPQNPLVIAGLALALLVAALVWTLRRRAPVAALGLSMAALAYLPVSNLLVIPTLFAERLLYLPSVGFCLALAAALLALTHRLPARVGVALVGLLALAHGTRAALRTPDWNNQRALFESAARVTPRCARVWLNLGVEDLRAHDLPSARQRLSRAVELAPFWGAAHSSLAVALDQTGQTDEAELHFRRAVEAEPGCESCVINLAGFFVNHHRPQPAWDLITRYRAVLDGPALDRLQQAAAHQLGLGGGGDVR